MPVPSVAQASPPFISITFSSHKIDTQIPLNHRLPVPSSAQPLATIIWLSVFIIWLGASYSMCLFVTGLFHLAECSQGSSVLWHGSEFLSFLKLNNIPLHEYITFANPFIVWWTPGFLQVLAVSKRAARSLDVQIPLKGPALNSFVSLCVAIGNT